MNRIDLSGIWNLKLDSEKIGVEKKYFEDIDFSDTIDLPGTISQQKKSPKTDERATGFLTDPYKFEGWAWYKKNVEIKNPSKKLRLVLERTRYTTLWINGKEIDKKNTINGKHIYEFSLDNQEAEKNISITILVSNIDYIVPGGHMTSPDTQTNWNGITGEIYLEEIPESDLAETKIFASDNSLKIIGKLKGDKNVDARFFISGVLNQNATLVPGKNEIQFNDLKNIKKWSDTNPNLYELEINLPEETYKYKIGFRKFEAVGKHFEVNGKKVFLRGKHDGLIFPQTGFAPTTVDEWKKVFSTAKDYGINHYRFHTCCPPEAAFTAADEMGIYMSPELPFWGTIQAPGEEGFNQEQQDYLINEGFQILDNFGNHPSFVMMSMGNELWGSEIRLDEIMEKYHNYDDRHLYTGGSNNFQFCPKTTEHEDYFVGVRFSKDALIRGSYAQCDAPLGFVQTDVPNSNHNYDKFSESSSKSDSTNEEKEIEIQYGTGVKKVKASGNEETFLPNKPCISHEVGQYCMYPNFEENKRFTGVLKPYNFEEFQKRLIDAGMENQAQDFFRDSSRLAMQCYKMEIEALLRSNEISGFQLLDIQDFTGQGTAVVGVLNAFMESKGIVTGEQWRSFCSDKVLLAEFEKFVWTSGEDFSADLIFHNYSDSDFDGQFMSAYLINTEDNEILYEENFEIKNPNGEKKFRGNIPLGNFKFQLEETDEYQKLCFLLVLNPDDEKSPAILNSYTLHIYPKKDDRIVEALEKLANQETVEIENTILTRNANTKSSNKKIIYFPTNFEGMETVEGTYCTDFWCYPMFRSISESMNRKVPVGTLGLTIKTDSELLENFPTDSYTTPKWYNIVSHATCVNLSQEKINPVIQMIDNFERNWKLGILFEDEDKIVCTSRLWEIAHEPEVVQFVKSLIG